MIWRKNVEFHSVGNHSVKITEFYSQKFRQINSFDLYINHKSCRLISRNICHVWVIFCVLYTVYIWLYCHHKETWSLLLPINSRKISCLRERLDISSDVFLFLETFLLDKKKSRTYWERRTTFSLFQQKRDPYSILFSIFYRLAKVLRHPKLPWELRVGWL